jgi:hypothetical protein
VGVGPDCAAKAGAATLSLLEGLVWPSVGVADAGLAVVALGAAGAGALPLSTGNAALAPVGTLALGAGCGGTVVVGAAGADAATGAATGAVVDVVTGPLGGEAGAFDGAFEGTLGVGGALELADPRAGPLAPGGAAVVCARADAA